MRYPIRSPFRQYKELSGFREFKMDPGIYGGREGWIEVLCDFCPDAVTESEGT